MAISYHQFQLGTQEGGRVALQWAREIERVIDQAVVAGAYEMRIWKEVTAYSILLQFPDVSELAVASLSNNEKIAIREEVAKMYRDAEWANVDIDWDHQTAYLIPNR